MTIEQTPQGGTTMKGNSSSGRFSYQRAEESLERGYHAMERCVQDHPASSALLTFAAGFGVGLLLGYAFTQPAQPRWYEPRAYEQLGRRVWDAMADAVPERVAGRFSS